MNNKSNYLFLVKLRDKFLPLGCCGKIVSNLVHILMGILELTYFLGITHFVSRKQRKLRVEVYCEVPWSLNCPLTFINSNNSNNFLDAGKIEYEQIFLF